MTTVRVSPFQPPAAQRHIVYSTQFGYYMIRNRGKYNEYSSIGSSGGIKQLFTVAGNDVDFNIYPGEYLYTPKAGMTRARTIGDNGLSQQPYVLSSLNNLSCSVSEFNQARGLTEHEKKRSVFGNHYQVIGPSLKSHVYEAVKQRSLDDPVALLGGIHHQCNQGPTDILPMEWVCWDIPDDTKAMTPDRTGFSTVTPTTRKLVPVPLRMAYRPMSSDALFLYAKLSKHDLPGVFRNPNQNVRRTNARDFTRADSSNSAEKDMLMSFARFLVITSKLNQVIDNANGVNVDDAIRLFDKTIQSQMTTPALKDEVDTTFGLLVHGVLQSEAIRQASQNVMEMVREPEREARSRITHQAVRGALRGERQDIHVK